MALKAQALDYNFRQDDSKMKKLNLSYVYGMKNFNQFVSDVFNYLVQGTLQSYRYDDNGEPSKKDIEYFYDLSSSTDQFLKNEPSFFKFYDYLEKTEDRNYNQNFAYDVIKSWDVPDYKIHEGVSCAGRNCEITKGTDISSCFSPVLFDKQNRAWYDAAWNAFYIACTGVKMNDVNPNGSWRVSSPCINMKDLSFSSLKNIGWKDLSSISFEDDFMSKEYSSVEGSKYPFTRYCQNYKELMIDDSINRTYYPAIRDWEKTHMSELTYSFWKPTSGFFGKTIDDFPNDTLTYFKDDLEKSDMVGGENTWNVGLDQTEAWKQYDSSKISSFSWISKPQRTIEFDESSYWRGQCSFITYDWRFNADYTNRNPEVIPPIKPVLENIYALAYIWTKFLGHDDNGTLKYITNATAQQQIPYYMQQRSQAIDIDWSVSFRLSTESELDLQSLIYKSELSDVGRAICNQHAVSTDTGWVSSDVQQTNTFQYNRNADVNCEGDSPYIEDWVVFDFGDLSGKCYYDQRENIYHCSVDLDDPNQAEYAEQMKLLFPRSREQQRRDELSALSAEYIPQIEELSAQVDADEDEIEELSIEIDELSSLSVELENYCYKDAYVYAWNNTYKNKDISQLSDFFQYYKNDAPYLNFVDGNFDNIYDYDFKGNLVDEIKNYISQHEALSGCPQIDSLEDFESAYNGYFRNNPGLSGYVEDLAQMCESETKQQINTTVQNFVAAVPYEVTKEEIFDFVGRLDSANIEVSLVWYGLLNMFVAQNLEEYMREYWTELFALEERIKELEDEIEELLKKIEELQEEYKNKKAEIEHKQYDIYTPSFNEIWKLTHVYLNPDAVIHSGAGVNTTSRTVECKMDVADGILSSVEYYDGLQFRYPMSFEEDKNEAIVDNAYLMFVRYYCETIKKEQGKTEYVDQIKPYVDSSSKDYDTFRKTTIPALTREVKNRIGYSSRASWFGGEYSDSEVNAYNMSFEARVKLSLEEPLHIAIDVIEREVEVDFNGEKWTAQVLNVNGIYNYDLGIGTEHVIATLEWEYQSKFKEPIPSKTDTSQDIQLTVSYPEPILCQTSWKCQD